MDLVQPLRWRKPRTVSIDGPDLFGDDVPDLFIAQVFAVMAVARSHTFEVDLRAARMMSLLTSRGFQQTVYLAMEQLGDHDDPVVRRAQRAARSWTGLLWLPEWPFPNVRLSIAAETHQWAKIRVPLLLRTPAAVRAVRCVPLLGPIDLALAICHTTGPESAQRGHGLTMTTVHWGGCCQHALQDSGIGWVIVGGQSGPDARPTHPDWVRTLRDQCIVAGIPFAFTGWGEWAPLGPVYDQVEEDDEADDARMDAAHLEAVEQRTVIELERDGTRVRGYQPRDRRTWLMAQLGERRAGRELDRRVWDEQPAATTDGHAVAKGRL